METDFFSIPQILADEQKVPVTFLNDVYNLGHLDFGSDEKDLKKGVKVEVPLWLARTLATKANIIKTELPKSFSQKLIGSLKADPNSVNLANVPYLYQNGLNLATITEEEPRLLQILQASFLGRYKEIFDKSQNMRDLEVTEFTRKLSYSEKQLFEMGYKSARAVQQWKNHALEKITVSSILNAGNKKRKVYEVNDNSEDNDETPTKRQM